MHGSKEPIWPGSWLVPQLLALQVVWRQALLIVLLADALNRL